MKKKGTRKVKTDRTGGTALLMLAKSSRSCKKDTDQQSEEVKRPETVPTYPKRVESSQPELNPTSEVVKRESDEHGRANHQAASSKQPARVTLRTVHVQSACIFFLEK